MGVSRRDFVRASVAGVVGLYAVPEAFAQAPSLQDEDGYKLWLRFAPPPSVVANQYRGAIRQVSQYQQDAHVPIPHTPWGSAAAHPECVSGTD